MLNRLLGPRPLRHRLGLMRSPNIWAATSESAPDPRTFSEWLDGLGLEVIRGHVRTSPRKLSYADFADVVESAYPRLRIVKRREGELDDFAIGDFGQARTVRQWLEAFGWVPTDTNRDDGELNWFLDHDSFRLWANGRVARASWRSHPVDRVWGS